MGGGRVPFGYYYDRNDGILHPKEEEAEIVRKAFDMYIDGYSCDNISKILGFKGERIVAQILKRKSNIGYIEYKGREYKGLHEPIVSEEVFYKAQECMKKRHTNSHINNENILSGLCYCGVCGARMRYQKWGKYHKLICYSQNKYGKEYMKRSDNCTNLKVKAKLVEAEVAGCFKDFIIHADTAKSQDSHREAIESSIKKSNAKIKKFYSLYAENESDNLLELIHEEEEVVKNLNLQLEKEKKKGDENDEKKIEEIRKIADGWDLLDNQEKNKVLKECVEKVVITGDDIEIRFVTF
jgi:site-specific DNA recombinase